MVVAGALFGWRVMIWVGLSGVIWFAVAAFGVVLITRDILAGARALSSLVRGLARRRRVLDDVVRRIQRAAPPPDGGDPSVP